MDTSSATKPQLPGNHQDAWDEARLEAAMKQLKLLHIKVRQLRDTIPRMIDPLIKKQPSPDVMFAAFMKSVNEAQAEIKEFTELMRDETSKEVFTHASKSREQNPAGIVPWKHAEHPDWFTMEEA